MYLLSVLFGFFWQWRSLDSSISKGKIGVIILDLPFGMFALVFACLVKLVFLDEELLVLEFEAE